MMMLMMAIRITIVRCDDDDNYDDDADAAEDSVKEITILTSKYDCDHIPDQIGVRKRFHRIIAMILIMTILSGYKDYLKEIIIIFIKMTIVIARIKKVKDRRMTIMIGHIKETKYDTMTVFIAHISEIKDDSAHISDQKKPKMI